MFRYLIWGSKRCKNVSIKEHIALLTSCAVSNVIWLAKTATAYPIGKCFLDVVWSARAELFVMKMADTQIFSTMLEQYFYFSGPILMQIFFVAVIGNARLRTWPAFADYGWNYEFWDEKIDVSRVRTTLSISNLLHSIGIRSSDLFWLKFSDIWSSSRSSENKVCPSCLSYQLIKQVNIHEAPVTMQM